MMNDIEKAMDLTRWVLKNCTYTEKGITIVNQKVKDIFPRHNQDEYLFDEYRDVETLYAYYEAGL